MKSQNDTYLLSNGVEVPCIGFGMWQTPDSRAGVNAVKSAINAGYTHIDTAQAYGNEECVKLAIDELGADRKKLAEKYGKSIAQICKRILKYLILNLKRTMSERSQILHDV